MITQHIIDVPTRVIISIDGDRIVSVDDFYVTDGMLVTSIGDHKNAVGDTVCASLMRNQPEHLIHLSHVKKRENEEMCRRITPDPFIGA